jgi:steroid 5-alpha reductase family enzyme
MFGGLILEALADAQKSRFKAQNPRQFCDVGLYRRVRCPNYFGEIMLWIGNWVVGFAFYTSAMQWIASLVGLICIVLIMMGSTKRLERAQDERYGAQSAYQEYARTVPVLFPFVPLYSLKHVRVFLE